MSLLRIIIAVLTLFSLLLAFTFYYRERPKFPVRAFTLLLITVVLMWLNYTLRPAP